MAKRKVAFVIDRPDFIQLRKRIEGIPGIESIDAAELRLREARTAFLEQRQTVRSGGKNVLDALALQLSDPRKLEEPAREYHRALLEWCRLAASAFETVHNQAADELESRREEFNKLANRVQNHPVKEERDAANEQLKALRRLDAEPFRIQAAALRGRNAVKAAFHFETGRSIPEANENAFVKATDPLRKVA